MRIVIAYDKDGNIVNVARVYQLPEDMPHPFADLTEEHRILSIEEPAEKLRDANLSDILRRYQVDTKGAKLVQRRDVYHVVPDKATGEWHVNKEDASEPISTHSKKDDAVDAAIELAKRNEPSQVKIHKADGTFQREYTYGEDPEKYSG